MGRGLGVKPCKLSIHGHQRCPSGSDACVHAHASRGPFLPSFLFGAGSHRGRPWCRTRHLPAAARCKLPRGPRGLHASSATPPACEPRWCVARVRRARCAWCCSMRPGGREDAHWGIHACLSASRSVHLWHVACVASGGGSIVGMAASASWATVMALLLRFVLPCSIRPMHVPAGKAWRAQMV